jgi:hypothetical protein
MIKVHGQVVEGYLSVLVLDFFHTGISFSICWIYVGRIRPMSGDNRPNINQK